jgi:hypothetical protein
MILIRNYYKTLICQLLGGAHLGFLVFTLAFSIQLAGQTPAKATQPQPEARLSKQEADGLFRSLDDIMRFASEDTNLPIRHSVKRELSSRDQVAQTLNDRMKDDEDAKRLERSELVLKKFGFLPRNFNLETYLVSLMREQVAGYYNVKDKTVYLMDWIPAEQQKPVMAHELTHALQDQNFDLKKWLAGDVKTDDKHASPEEDAKEIESDEEETARQALVEGQGMAVLIDYLLKDSGQSVNTVPAFVETLKQNISEGQDSPIYSNAPLYMRESLAFPYRYGLGFVQELLKKGGKDLAYAGAMKNPPQNSRQIMNPAAYLAHEKLPPVVLPNMGALLGKDYERCDVGSVGEFDIMVLLKQFTNEKLADQISSEWRGGAYYAALKHETADTGAKSQEKDSGKAKPQNKDAGPPTTRSVALLYLSRWSSPDIAQKFVKAYAATLLDRYRFADPEQAEPKEEKEAATAKAESAAAQPVPTHWMTDEGLVTIEQHGDTVLVLESFDATTELELSKAVWEGKPQSQPAKVATK